MGRSKRAGSGATAPVVGRDDELALLDAWAADITNARGRALVLSGEPGIGKSTLLDCAAAMADKRGVRVVSARGTEAEQDLPFAALSDVLRPLHHLLPSLKGPQRDALEAALGVGPGPAGDPFVTSVAALALLAAAAKETPTAVLVDDAHVLDPASARVLAFVARRVEHDHLGVLVAARGDEPSAFDTDGLDELVLKGLSDTDAALLLMDVTQATTPPAVVARLVAGTGGNPLALRELAASLTPDELSGAAPLPDPLSVGPAVRQALARRLATLDATARRALLIVATADGQGSKTVIDAAARLDIPAAVFDVHERTGALVLRDGSLEFAHPLVRAAVYQGAAPAEVRDVHAAVADVIDETIDPAAHAWHRANASVGPDDAVAAALDAVAAQATSRGAYSSAARASERAAELSTGPAGAYNRWCAAASAAHLAGELANAVRLYDRAVSIAQDDVQRGMAVAMRAAPRYWLWPALRQYDALTAEAGMAAMVDPSLGAMLNVLAGASAITEGDMRRARAAATTALEHCGDTGPVRDAARALDAAINVVSGTRAQGVPVLVEVLQSLTGTADPLTQWTRLLCAQSLCWAEEHADAARALDPWISEARAQGRVGELPYPLAMRADVDHRAGAWDRAWASATEAVELAQQTGQQGLGQAYCLMVLAQVEAGRGPEDACRAHAAHGSRLAAQHELHALAGYGSAAIGLLELGLGNPGAAARELATVAEAADRHGDTDPNQLRWRADYIEALLAIGRAEEAERQLRVFEGEAAATASRWAGIAAARCRALFDAPNGVAALEAAVEAGEGTPYAFDQARARLALGQALRRARRPSDARAPLERALAQFSLLGAAPWADRTAAELRAIGGRPTTEATGGVHRLTSQEMRIAWAIADGATNREAAAQLFLSPRTIEFHLGRIYRKLGVRTRTELAARLREQADG